MDISPNIQIGNLMALV